jgi:hypothetical protein
VSDTYQQQQQKAARWCISHGDNRSGRGEGAENGYRSAGAIGQLSAERPCQQPDRCATCQDDTNFSGIKAILQQQPGEKRRDHTKGRKQAAIEDEEAQQGRRCRHEFLISEKALQPVAQPHPLDIADEHAVANHDHGVKFDPLGNDTSDCGILAELLRVRWLSDANLCLRGVTNAVGCLDKGDVQQRVFPS